jgi:hypothetical protein
MKKLIERIKKPFVWCINNNKFGRLWLLSTMCIIWIGIPIAECIFSILPTIAILLFISLFIIFIGMSIYCGLNSDF